MSDVDPIVAFYRDGAPDGRGRRRDEILRRDDAWLEYTHDYIQWLFPLAEPSAFNPQAPILTEETIAVFRADLELRQRLLQSLVLMLGFYGLTLSTEPGSAPRIEPAADFAAKRRGWLRAGDHNQLRLTRILASLRLLGLGDHSQALFACLAAIARDHPHDVSAATLDYWRRGAAG